MVGYPSVFFGVGNYDGAPRRSVQRSVYRLAALLRPQRVVRVCGRRRRAAFRTVPPLPALSVPPSGNILNQDMGLSDSSSVPERSETVFHAHRFLLRSGLAIGNVFGWIFVFEYFFIVSASLPPADRK